ncbi:MAG: hypothetical protein HQ515_07670 [Phycisphaeraceae bacterium]|nr:hypothetical protein [Phycisphaeraceae bacterium]
MARYNINSKNRNEMVAALEYLKSIRITKEDGTVAYEGLHGYRLAFMVLWSVFKSGGSERDETTTRLRRAINKVMNKGEVTVTRLVNAMEATPKASSETPKFYVTKPFYCRGINQIGRRNVNGCLVRLERVIKVKNKGDLYSGGTKTGKLLNSRNSIHGRIKGKKYLPEVMEGNFHFVATVRESDSDRALHIGEKAINRHVAILNFLVGRRSGSGWDINPVQPRAKILPGAYTIVHDDSGDALLDTVHFNEQCETYRTEACQVQKKISVKLNEEYGCVVESLKKHYNPQHIYSAFDIYGNAVIQCDINLRYTGLWTCFERLMHFGTTESHEKMIKRFLSISVTPGGDIMRSVIYALGRIRNKVIHTGADVSDLGSSFTGPDWILENTVHELFRFHMNLPSVIKSESDFMLYSDLPCDSDEITKQQEDLKNKISFLAAVQRDRSR